MCIISQPYYSEFLLCFLPKDRWITETQQEIFCLLLKEKQNHPIDNKSWYVLFCECILARQLSIE